MCAPPFNISILSSSYLPNPEGPRSHSDAFAVVVAKLGFKPAFIGSALSPCLLSEEGRENTARSLCGRRSQTRLLTRFHQQDGKQGRFPPALRQGCRIGRESCPLLSGV
ncbi:hypothetical protein E4K67_01575 [Desulfosporosinus fructosivorans]|uniref:Uncharacterized protein n=1 Tax=Desulfosporosinus fructosivorans TaxID=2018669 RepID=A0A4Z0R995_9FIRM|nr:hypothetical protein E4K67_01575 [Desulfosporosinus fructosivorans]